MANFALNVQISQRSVATYFRLSDRL